MVPLPFCPQGDSLCDCQLLIINQLREPTSFSSSKLLRLTLYQGATIGLESYSQEAARVQIWHLGLHLVLWDLMHFYTSLTQVQQEA